MVTTTKGEKDKVPDLHTQCRRTQPDVAPDRVLQAGFRVVVVLVMYRVAHFPGMVGERPGPQSGEHKEQ